MTDTDKEQDCCKWIKDYWLDTVLLFIAIAGVTWLTCPEWMLLLERPNVSTESNTAIRTLAFSYGAIVAFYGLSLGIRRLKATEKQLEHTGTQLEQTGRQLKITEASFFYERFERGTELLKGNEPHTRIAGIRMLKNVHETVELDNQKKLVRESLLDFICSRAGIYDPKKKTKPKPRKNRVDIEVAIKTLGELVSEDINHKNLQWIKENQQIGKLQQGKEQHEKSERLRHQQQIAEMKWFDELNLQNLDLRLLHLQRVKLRYANLIGAGLGGADLTGAHLRYVNLAKANLTRAILRGATLSEVNLYKTDLTRAYLRHILHSGKQKQLQAQLKEAIYEKGNPPSLPNGFDKIPEQNAYVWEKDGKGNWYHKFDENGK